MKKKNGTRSRSRWLGKTVRHGSHGVGRVIAEWGPWSSCPMCHRDVAPRRKTECCLVKPMIISGNGVFDVRFADGTHSISKRWLKLARKSRKAKLGGAL